MYRKWLISLGLMVCAGTSGVYAAFEDTADRSIAYLYEQGLVEGYADGTFRPEGTINRAELIKMLMHVSGRQTVPAVSSCFADVPMDSWYAPYVCTAKVKGWVSGYADGLYRPGNTINRAEAVKIAYNILMDEAAMVDVGTSPYVHEYQDVRPSDWFAVYVHTLAAQYFVDHTQYFDPGAAMTRGDMAELVFRKVLSQKLSSILDVTQVWDGEQVTDLNGPGESYIVLKEDLLILDTQARALTLQDLSDAQQAEDDRYLAKLAVATFPAGVEPDIPKYRVRMEHDGITYGVVSLDRSQCRAKPSFVRSFYTTWAIVAMDSLTGRLLGYDLLTESVDRPSLFPTIDLVAEDMVLLLRFHGEGPAPGSYWSDAIAPRSVMLRTLPGGTMEE